MKKICYLSVFALLTIISSCQKDEDESFSDTTLPTWLEEIVNQQEECFTCSVTKYEYKGEIYYNYYCGIMSCVFCHLYKSDGELVSGKIDLSDFLENAVDKGIIWQCPDD